MEEVGFDVLRLYSENSNTRNEVLSNGERAVKCVFFLYSSVFNALMRGQAGMAGGPAKPSMVVMEGCWPVFLDRTLSNSRALERFRNQVR